MFCVSLSASYYINEAIHINSKFSLKKYIFVGLGLCQDFKIFYEIVLFSTVCIAEHPFLVGLTSPLNLNKCSCRLTTIDKIILHLLDNQNLLQLSATHCIPHTLGELKLTLPNQLLLTNWTTKYEK